MDDRLLGNHTPRAFTRCLSRVTLLTLYISMVLALLAAAPAASAAGSQFFPQTGHAVSGPFMAYWQAHGGLPIFGYPISDAQNEADPSSGKTALVQWFERARFELHPEFAGTPYEVELGLLGNQLAQGRQGQAPFEPITPFASTPDRVFFPETSHSLADSFQAYWAANGGLPIFGYPISEAFPEANPADGQVYTVQYFERARFEAHTANPPAYQVELGLLGSQLMPSAPASQQVAITVSGGASQVTIAPDRTALMPPGTAQMVVALQFPQPIDPASIQVQIRQLAGPDAWQLAPTGRMPTRSGYIFGLRGSSNSPPYFLAEVTRGAGQPAIFFGVQLGSDQANPPLVANWNDPVALLNAYYNAIRRHEYARAYSYWENPGAPNSVTASFADFASGYANTVAVNVTTGDVASDAGAGNIFYQVPTVIVARQTDGATQRFYGCYLLHRVNVEIGNTTPPYPIALRAAHIVAAPADADTAALLDQANALVQAGQCGQ
jgi:hypothetical protein